MKPGTVTLWFRVVVALYAAVCAVGIVRSNVKQPMMPPTKAVGP